SRMTWMVSGAVRDACRAALEEWDKKGRSLEVDVERIYRHPRTTPLDPETGQVTGERAHVAYACAAMRRVAEGRGEPALPPAASERIEEAEPDAPYGGKGVGEPPTVVSTPAVVAALRAATGRELSRVPVRPDDIVGL